MNYTDHVKNIASRIISYLESQRDVDYDPFDDLDLVNESVHGIAQLYGKENGWYGQVLNRYESETYGMLLPAAQMIAGNSPSIEDSFNGQYRKDMFRDVAEGALLNDVILEIKLSHPEVLDPEFCDRAR